MYPYFAALLLCYLRGGVVYSPFGTVAFLLYVCVLLVYYLRQVAFFLHVEGLRESFLWRRLCGFGILGFGIEGLVYMRKCVAVCVDGLVDLCGVEGGNRDNLRRYPCAMTLINLIVVFVCFSLKAYD